MRDEIAALTARLGVTTLFVTHDQAEALAMSHRVAVMNDGRIVEAADPETLAEAPRAAFTARFLGGRTVLEGAVAADAGRPVFVTPGAPRIPLPADAAANATHCVLRASRLRLREPDGAGDGVPVTVENAVFLGETRQITVRAGEARILVHAPAERAAPRPGETLTLEIPDAAVRLLNESAGG
jgi:putative spermidine/putrescine transport system ATP-binding protein